MRSDGGGVMRSDGKGVEGTESEGGKDGNVEGMDGGGGEDGQLGMGGEEKREDEGDRRSWAFGGTLTRQEGAMGVPVCKHILAAMMEKAAPELFVEGTHLNVSRDVGKEEMAGWGAGWGDGG